MATTFGQSLSFRLQDKELNFGARLPIARGPKTNVTTKAQGRADSYLIKPDGNSAVKWVGFSWVDMQAKQKIRLLMPRGLKVQAPKREVRAKRILIGLSQTGMMLSNGSVLPCNGRI